MLSEIMLRVVRNDGRGWISFDEYREGFLDELAAVNALVLDTADRVIAADPAPWSLSCLITVRDTRTPMMRNTFGRFLLRVFRRRDRCFPTTSPL